MIVKFDYHSKQVVLEGPDQDHIITLIDRRKSFYEIQMLNTIAESGRDGIYIDIGANIGNHSIFMSMFSSATKIIAFEPNVTSIAFLQRNIQHNHIGNVEIVEKALSDKPGRALVIPRLKDNLGSATLKLLDAGDIAVDTLDSCLNDCGRIELIKIDVEGFEKKVITGGMETIRRWLPELFIEAQTKRDLKDISSLLFPLGYLIKGQYNATPTYHFSHPQRFAS